MTRSVLFYGKKRGNRRTGNSRWGHYGLLLFFSFFFLLGCVTLVLFVQNLLLPEWRVNQQFIAGTCLVKQTRVGEKISSKGSRTYRPEVLIEYQVDDQTYSNWTYDILGVYSGGRQAKEAELAQFRPGQEYPVWYDPVDPQVAVLVRGYTWFAWLMLLLPLAFLGVGGGGLTYRLLSGATSVERRAHMVRRVSEVDLFEDVAPNDHDFPTVPRERNLINSPGTTLAFRLPLAVSPVWALSMVALATLLWNGLTAVFVTIAVNSHVRGAPEWFLTFFTTPFVLIGLGLVYYTFKQVLIVTGIGPTLVEISDHPLRPGEQYRVFLAQSGRLSVNTLRMTLVCQERATYQQGTNTRTETVTLLEQELLLCQSFEIRHDQPLERLVELQVPARAMHSFKSTHNELAWKLVVHGDVARWPDFAREFPLLVYPPHHGKDHR